MKPVCNLFCGVNGAGKSTLYYNKLESISSDEFQKLGYRINSDEFVQSFGSWKDSAHQFRASKIAISIRKRCVENGQNFTQESTLCGKSILRLIDELDAKNWQIRMFYVGIDSPESAKKRVAMRVAKGGHDIDSALIEKRYVESLRNLALVLPKCDEVYLFDNSRELKEVARIIKGALKIKDCINTSSLEYLRGILD